MIILGNLKERMFIDEIHQAVGITESFKSFATGDTNDYTDS